MKKFFTNEVKFDGSVIFPMSMLNEIVSEEEVKRSIEKDRYPFDTEDEYFHIFLEDGVKLLESFNQYDYDSNITDGVVFEWYRK